MRLCRTVSLMSSRRDDKVLTREEKRREEKSRDTRQGAFGVVGFFL